MFKLEFPIYALVARLESEEMNSVTLQRSFENGIRGR